MRLMTCIFEVYVIYLLRCFVEICIHVVLENLWKTWRIFLEYLLYSRVLSI